VRLKQLTAAGFRGFNSPRTIVFSNALTLISAPNSHGKTSVIEALEFLLYGQTSKVEAADSKDEYKDSYLNRHYGGKKAAAFVEASFLDNDGKETVLRCELHSAGIQRFANGQPTEAWPFAEDLAKCARPFVVQHALKRLLLAAPSQRFQGFAEILGLSDVDQAQQALVNLCTKPEAQLPSEARRLLAELSVFDARLKAQKETAPIAKALAQGSSGISEAYEKLNARGLQLLKKKVSTADLSAALVDLRNAAAGKVYSGSVAIKSLTTYEQQKLSAAREKLDNALTPEFVQRYARLAVVDASHRLHKELQFLGLGIELAIDAPENCPFCEQSITPSIHSRVGHRREELRAKVGAGPDIGTLRAEMSASLRDVAEALSGHTSLLAAKSSDLITANLPESAKKIQALFGKGNEHGLLLIAAAGAALGPSYKAITPAANKAAIAIGVCTDALLQKAEDIAQVEAVVKGIAAYLASVEVYLQTLAEVTPTLAEPSRLLQQAVDAQAGTTELSLLIEMLGNRIGIQRAARIKETLDSLKELKKHVDQAVGKTMEDAFTKELTGAVMNWYQRIRTTGDPDVHFSGFAMDRTKAGDFKNRRVKVDAKSYGVELASAVSSLSESKLNALGLCMSIATAVRAPGPWEFLVLDDPIQSWDDDHEFQFIQMIRRLAEEEGKQIILMSHREGWVDQVSDGCRSLNGTRYHISAYTQDGPVINEQDWASVDQRLREALALATGSQASPGRLQQAEGEIRLAACQLAAQVAKTKLNRVTGAQGINSDKCRSILTEAGCEMELVDRVVATFATTDEAHHAPKHYVPNAQRIRQYHGALTELKNWLKSQSA
jgi:DNA repair exonuclease SbcCD ATPase subunit